MRFPSLSVTALSGFGLVVALGFSAPTDANQSPRSLGVPAQRGRPAAIQNPRMLRRIDTSFAAGCSNMTTYGQFIGGGYEDVASYPYTGVLSGVKDEACGEGSAIGAGGTITNGGSDAPSGGSNETDSTDSFIGAGDLNWVSGQGNGSVIAGGGYQHANTECCPNTYGNIVSGPDAFIGAGDMNQVTGGGSFIGAGGYMNPTTAGNHISSVDSFIGAGDQNTVAGQESFVGGGQGNDITSGATEAVIGGGVDNVATAQKATVGGGEGNESEGSFATIPGGYRNLASGNESFAAGSQAEAEHAGSFVWSDYASGETPLNDGGINEFVVRASGGVYMYSSAKSPYSGVELNAGSGTWSSVSDRNAKTGIVPLDDASVLSKVATLPISTWQYKTETGVRHVGPMAQDFYAAFGVGEDDRHITSIDEDGVALAAIKALNRQNGRLLAENGRMRSELGALRSEMQRFEVELKLVRAR